MITPVLGWLSRIFRAASRPSISGIRMSTRAMSGSWLPTRSTSSWPLAASPTTSMPSAMSRYRRSPWRTREWSSAIATRIVTLRSPPDTRRCAHILYGGHDGAERRSEDVVRVDREQGQDPEAGRLGRKHRGPGDVQAFEPEGQAPEGREQGQHEAGHRHQRPTLEHEREGDQQARPQVDGVRRPEADRRV